jgi:hypothetical protein
MSCDYSVHILFKKFVANALEVSRLVHPWVSADLSKSWSLGWVIAEHSHNKILEFSRQVLAIDFLPVLVSLSRNYKVVEIFFNSCFLEWEDALDHNE